MRAVRDEERIIAQYPLLHDIFVHMPCAAAMHKIVCDSDGTAVDYYTTEVNPLFERLLGVDAASVLGKLASEKLQHEELRHWLSIFGPVALEGHARTYVMHSSLNDAAFTGTALCPRKGYFFVMFTRQGEKPVH